MRQIKFRVWSESRKKWLNECMFDMEIKGAYDFSTDSSMRYNYKTDVIIEQFTGLTDKNSVDVYEHDIAKISVYGHKSVNAKVIFECGSFWLYSPDLPPVFDNDADGMVRLSTLCLELEGFELSQLHQLEVIGNVHQNPELLEKNDE